MTTTISPTQLQLQLELGDIIEITAPTNDTLHNHIFLIDYIDSNRIRLIDDLDLSTHILTVENNNLTDKSIIQIAILNKADEKGYARQHDLLPNTWIELKLGGEFPTTLTGQITDLEEDMIEIKTYPDEETIYLDFAYKGIPLDIPIETIHILEEPPKEIREKEKQRKDKEKRDIIEEVEDKDEYEDEDKDEREKDMEEKEEKEEQEVILKLPKKEVEEKLKQVLVETDEINFFDDVDSITQEVAVSEEEKRYNIDVQTNDLMDEILSTIPNIERTNRVLNRVHQIIRRFKELREKFSTFDENGNVDGFITKGANYKPLVEKLFHLDKLLFWILPVVKNKIEINNETTSGDDIDTINIDEGKLLKEFSEKLEQYRQQTNTENENSYDSYIQEINRFFTPYKNLYSGVEQTNEINEETQIITEKEVNTNLNVIINNVEDNLQEFYTHLYDMKKLKLNRFVIMRYNLGLNRLELENNKKSFKKKQQTKNDKLSLTSFLTMPKSFIQYSHINLPSTTIYDKTNLNHTPISYWNILRKNTSITTKIVDDLENDVEYDSNSLFKSIQNITLSNNLSQEQDTYRRFLQVLIPKTRVLFHLLKPNMTQETSYYNVIKSLEPFMIYQDDISYKQYQDIAVFIKKNIDRLKKSLAQHKKDTNVLRNLKTNIQFTSSLLLNILGANHMDTVVSNYHLQKDDLTSYLYSNIIKTDYGNYYNTYIQSLNKHLSTNIDIEETLKDTLNQLTQEQTQREEQRCNNYVLTKKYHSIEELNHDDNTTNVYFDKEYDDTTYQIIEEYKNERELMGPQEFEDFLIKQIQENAGFTREKAKEHARAMIEGKRKVRDGQYAILQLQDTETDVDEFYYYKRENDKWVYDEELSKSITTEDQSIFCNIQKDCIQLKEGTSCETTEKTKDELLKENIETMMKQVEGNEMKAERNIQEKLEYFRKVLERLHIIQENERLKYTTQLYNYGIDVEENSIIHSPYIKLRNMILSQSDIVERMDNLYKFVTDFTRQANIEKNESPYWFYCNETNTKLLPTFFYQLAQAFLQGENYVETLNRICAERGELSDDGDKWVDKHSGYTIRMIDYDTEEGYTEEGYKITRDVLSTDEDILNWNEEEREEQQLYNSTEGNTVKKIVLALSFYLGITIDESLHFIVEQVILKASKQIPSREKYERLVKAQKAKGKKMASYEIKKNQLLILFSGIYVLIVIQTSIPGLKTKKTFPGCSKSFNGFPFSNDTTETKGIEYIACVLKKISSSQKPWNAIKNLSETNIKNNLITIYQKVLSNDSLIQDKLNKKREHIQEYGDDEDMIPNELNISNWNTFLPPLNQLKLNVVKNITEEFKKKLKTNIATGNPEQFKQLSIIYGKMIHYSFHIIQSINDIVEKEPALLETVGGEPFLQNVCCNEGELTTNQYFNEKDNTINKYNTIVRSLKHLYENTKQLAKSSILFNVNDTKMKYPPIKQTFSEETIYLAFIKFCKINKNIPLNETLKRLCLDNTSEFQETNTIQEKIDIMKREGKMYDNQSFQELLKLVHRENEINIEFHRRTASNKQILTSILNHLEDKDSNIPVNFRSYIEELLNMNEIVKEAQREKIKQLRNYLLRSIQSLKEEIKNFIQENANVNRNIRNKVFGLIDTLMEFKEQRQNEITDLKKEGGQEYTVLNDEELTTTYSIQFIQTFLQNIMIIYPTILLNQMNYSYIEIPNHWELSQQHEKDIKQFIRNNYEGLRLFYGKQDLNQILINIQEKTKDIRLLIDHTPFQSSIYKDGKKHTSVFNSVLVKELYEFYFFYVLKEYIDLQYSNDVNLVELDIEENNNVISNDILNGDKLELRENIASLLCEYLLVCDRQKKRINYNRKTILDLVLRSKEREKDIKTRQLKELTDEERKADGALRKGKLGRWNIGLQKGLTQYVKETYDTERAEMEQEAIIDAKLGKIDEVTEMNRDIYAMDMLERNLQETELDKEAYDMSELPEDDDYGEMDGDERFY